MDQAAEGPQREQGHAEQRVQLVRDGGVGHGADVGVQLEQAAEPHRHAQPVVVGVGDGGGGGREPGQQDDGQQRVDQAVAAAGRGPYGGDAKAAVQQDGEARDGGETGGAAQGEGHGVVDALADSQAFGEGFGDEQAHHMAADDQEQGVVEEGPADAQQAGFVELAGAGGEAEAVVAVAPGGAGDQDHQDEVGQHSPQSDA